MVFPAFRAPTVVRLGVCAGRTRWAYHLQGQLSSIFLVPDGNVVARTSRRRQEIIIYQLVTCESIAVPVLHRPVAHRMNMSSSSVRLSTWT